MSGILGLFNLDGAPVESRQLSDMASLLTRRGPDRTGIWHSGPIGLGHTLLATTPEAVFEQLPLEHGTSGCVITGDVRLDNRPELLAALGLADRSSVTGDAEIVLAAYLEWGEPCVERFLGDFAFAIWDPRHQRLFCARDHMGMRQLIYHHTPGRFFAFATEPRAILVLPQTPYRINEGRIADFLVQELEGIDKTSTFFEEVYRLPPAHTMTVAPEGMRQRRYWTLEPGTELRLPSNEAYAEAFLEVFTEAVRCRLRSAGPAGSMLSGGIDSGSIVAVASGLVAVENRGPLYTFSAVSPDGDADAETQGVHVALTMEGLAPCTVNSGELCDLAPRLEQLMWSVDEPFDGHMTLVRAMYLTARQRGLTMLLDGVAGDIVLSSGDRLARLLRAGHWRDAYREAVGRNRHWNGGLPPSRALAASARGAFVPDVALRQLRPLRQKRRVERLIGDSLLSRDFAQRVALGERYRMYRSHRLVGLQSSGTQRARAITHPDLVVGRERYDRVAGVLGMEPRDPFCDIRVAELCLLLPDGQTTDHGCPKAILRRAMVGRLPDEIRWGRHRRHLGWSFTRALMQQIDEHVQRAAEASLENASAYIDVIAAQSARHDDNQAESVYNLAYLGSWIQRHEGRPEAMRK